MGLYDFSKLVNKGNKIIKKNGGFPVHHMEYKLPANTLRLKFENSSINPLDGVSSAMPSGIEWKEVGDGIWDLTYNNTNWSNLLNGFFYNSKHRADVTKTVYYDIIDAGDISNVTNLTKSFRRCTGLKNICLFDTSNVTNMYATFCGAWSLKKCPLFNTSKVTDMHSLFSSLTASVNDTMDLEYVPLLDTTNVTDMLQIFACCIKLKSIPQFNTAKVTTMEGAFSGCEQLTTIPLLDTGKVTNMDKMFSTYISITNVGSVTHISSLKTVPSLDTSSVTSMGEMFRGCNKLEAIPPLNTSNVTTMKFIFMGCESIKTIPQLDTKNVTSMHYMFSDCTNLKSISQLDTSKVTKMSGMFNKCTSLITIPSFNTVNLEIAEGMFNECTSLVSVPLFDTSKVNSMRAMFYKCISLKRIPQFNTSNVENFTSFASMYWEENAALEEIPDLDYSKGKNFTSAFHSVRKAKFIPENMNLSSAIDCCYMFKNCHLIENIPDITMPTNQLEESQEMFYECFNIKTGIKSMYDKLLLAFREDGKQTEFNPEDAGKPVTFTNTFIKCGVDADGNYASETAQAERAQIPTSWGGDLTE